MKFCTVGLLIGSSEMQNGAIGFANGAIGMIARREGNKMTKGDIHPEHIQDYHYIANPNCIHIRERTEALNLIMMRKDGNDLDENTARYEAELELRKNGELGGWGGDWYFEDTQRLNYDTVQVIFVK